MKYIDEFRNGDLARHLADKIARQVRPDRHYRFMEFCGGHTHAIARYGLADLLPPQVQLVHGPGCPVCVLPVGRIDLAIALALEHRVILCTYADTLRVPASHGLSLLQARARGGDVRMVYSTLDVLQIARDHPQQQVVFLAIGFETTTPATALAVLQAQRERLENVSVLCCHVLTPPAMTHILVSAGDEVALDGFIGPAHVSTVIGSRPFEAVAQRHRKPVVIAGFEPLDLLQAVLMLVRQVNDGRAEVENEFTRVVTPNGNRKAQHCMDEVFELRAEFEWRGLSELPHSALKLRAPYARFDAEHRYQLSYQPVADHPACACAAILRGIKRPQDCRLFGNVCTPQTPVGACMVSSEGACAAHYRYQRFTGAS